MNSNTDQEYRIINNAPGLFCVSPYAGWAPSFRVRIEDWLKYCNLPYEIFGPKDRTAKRLGGINLADIAYEFKLRTARQHFGPALIQKDITRLGVSYPRRSLDFIQNQFFYDIDDAIFLETSKNAFFDRSRRIKELMGMAKTVIAGNNFLADYSKQYSANVVYVPTCVPDFVPKAKDFIDSRPLVVGWLGSASTSHYLRPIVDALLEVKKDLGFEVRLVGDLHSMKEFRKYPFQLKQWRIEEESNDLSEFDIALNPLPASDWEKGKCAYKTLLYARAGAAVLGSNVGVSGEILMRSNSPMPSTFTDWGESLRYLSSEHKLRIDIAYETAKIVASDFTFSRWKSEWLQAIDRKP